MSRNEQAKVSPSGCLLCPRCGGEMNFHAEKVDRGADAGADADLDGVVAEFHTCPGCKYVLERLSGQAGAHLLTPPEQDRRRKA